MHHSEHPGGISTCACTALRKASRAVTRLYDEALQDNEMTIIQFSILRNLSKQAALALTELADLLVMERTTLYRALAPLERRGWVTVDEGTGRAKVAALSEAGGRALAAATEAWEGVQHKLVDAIGTKDWALLQGALERVVATTRGLTL